MLWDSTPMCLAQPPRSKPNLNETQLTQTQNQNQAKPVAIWPGYWAHLTALVAYCAYILRVPIGSLHCFRSLSLVKNCPYGNQYTWDMTTCPFLCLPFQSEGERFHVLTRPRSIYQYSNMAPRLSGQTSIFAVVFFVFESLLGIERQKKLKKFTVLTRKPRSHVRILIYRTWPIVYC